jgi:hypothetical protein
MEEAALRIVLVRSANGLILFVRTRDRIKNRIVRGANEDNHFFTSRIFTCTLAADPLKNTSPFSTT